RAHRVARRGDEDRLRKLGADARRRLLVLEAVAEDEVEAAAGEVAEALLELGRRARLDVADLGAELVADRLQARPGAGVPAAVGDRAGREQRHAEGRRVGRLRAAGGEGDARGERGDAPPRPRPSRDPLPPGPHRRPIIVYFGTCATGSDSTVYRSS